MARSMLYRLLLTSLLTASTAVGLGGKLGMPPGDGFGWISTAYAQDDHDHDSGDEHEGGPGGGGGHDGGGHGGGGQGYGGDGQGQGGPSQGGPGHGRAGDATDELEDLLRRSGHGGTGGGHAEADEESDRPAWAQGNREANPQGGGQPAGAGGSRGGLYGDLVVVLRDDDGVPVLLALPSGDQVVQPLDADGNLIPLNDNGEPVDAAAAALLQEVEFGRLSSARSPSQVYDHALAEAYDRLASAFTLDENHNVVLADGASITHDAAGRLVITVGGQSSTLDSPLANQALYAQLLSTGSISGVVTLGYVDDNDETVYLSKEVSFVPTLDFSVAAGLLAGAADKTGNIDVDLVAYQNSILGVNTVVDGKTVAWYDYSSFSYDRAATYAGQTVTYLEPMTDASGTLYYVGVTRSILDAVFGGADGVFDPTTENATGSNIGGFASAADDALQVIEFVHDKDVPSG